MNRPRRIRRFPLALLALLPVGLTTISLSLGQTTNTPAEAAGGITNNQQKFKRITFDEAIKPSPGGRDTNSQPKSTSAPVAEVSDTPPGAGETNSQKKFIPPPANSFSFQEARTAQPAIQSPTNATVSLKEWQTRAASGDASAQYDLGWCYYSGQDLPRNYTEAVKWTRKAAEQGHAHAQYNLGCFYHTRPLSW